jgi:hypothetical protein
VPKGEKKVQVGPSVRWDTADMDTLHGTVFSVEVNRGEICLLFGSRTLTTGKGMETVVVSNRIILNPFTAKRLFVLLRRVMARHELPFEINSNDLRAFMETSN